MYVIMDFNNIKVISLFYRRVGIRVFKVGGSVCDVKDLFV